MTSRPRLIPPPVKTSHQALLWSVAPASQDQKENSRHQRAARTAHRHSEASSPPSATSMPHSTILPQASLLAPPSETPANQLIKPLEQIKTQPRGSWLREPDKSTNKSPNSDTFVHLKGDCTISTSVAPRKHQDIKALTRSEQASSMTPLICPSSLARHGRTESLCGHAKRRPY